MHCMQLPGGAMAASSRIAALGRKRSAGTHGEELLLVQDGTNRLGHVMGHVWLVGGKLLGP